MTEVDRELGSISTLLGVLDNRLSEHIEVDVKNFEIINQKLDDLSKQLAYKDGVEEGLRRATRRTASIAGAAFATVVTFAYEVIKYIVS